MARRGDRFAAAIPGDPNDPHSWRGIVDDYLLSLELRALSPATIYGRRRALARFASWALTQDQPSPLDVDENTLHQHQVHLHRHVTRNGARLAVRTRQQYLIALRGLYSWLRRTGQIERDPAIDIELPKAPDQLPRHFLTAEEAETIVALPDTDTALGQRDHTMLEVLYATGIRRTELANICINDVNLDRRSLFIRHGKGARDRLTPTGERAGINTGNCHTFRHTMATLMLQGGADLRSIQTMLGHRNLASTERYTHINIDHLTRIHASSHPGARSQPDNGDR